MISDEVLALLRDDLVEIGYDVESGKTRKQTINRPVFFGENGAHVLKHQIDAFHEEWKCGLEVEAGRSIDGNAIYRDLFQAMVMIDVEHLCLAVPLYYRRKDGVEYSRPYEKTSAVADTLYAHSRVVMPYDLTVIGY